MEAQVSVDWTFFSITSLETLIGTFTNGFIIFRIFFLYWKHQHVSGCEKIIAALSISNLCYTCVTFANMLTFTICPMFIMSAEIFPVLYNVTLFIIICSAWLTASLSFYYYVKIKHFSSNFLSGLKLRINYLASWMILGSVLLSLLCSLLNMLQKYNYPVDVSTLNNTSLSDTPPGAIYTDLYISFISSFLPFSISLGTTASNSWSLHLHHRKMARNQVSSSNSNVRRYGGAIKVMVCLLMLYVLINVAQCLFFFKICDSNSNCFWVIRIIVCAYSPLQSILLSLSTIKLKKAWMKMFHCNTGSMEDDGSRKE